LTVLLKNWYNLQSLENKEFKMNENVQYFLALGMPEGMDWLWILLIALLIFGGSRLPSLARSLGKSVNEFKKGLNEAKDVKDETESEVKKLKDDTTKDVSNTGEPGKQ
jgi:sec-independent protein translocase protein TatA